MAIRAAEVVGLNVAGVDIIRSSQGPLILEVNSSPGLEGIETSTKKDIAGEIMAFIEKNSKRRHNGRA
jgi:ribosomal protein S6--L-glutamate ligase